MEVSEGYKLTEVGVIPDDWSCKNVSSISKPVRGGSPRPAGDPKYFNGSFIPWVTVAALTNISPSQNFVSATDSYLTYEGSLHSRVLEKGTLIIANSGATLGVAKILSMKSCANDGIAALLQLEKNIDKLYLTYYINTQTKHLREVVATGNGQPNLNTELIGDIKIPLPPTKAEQTAIATALSDTDELIQSLEKLIAKKQVIKQGTMQLLLTGKQRLPGFSGEWEVKKLGEIINSFQNGYAFSASGYVDDGIPIVTMAQIGLDGRFQLEESKINHWRFRDFDKLKSFHLKDGDVIIAMTDVTPEKNLIGRMTIVHSNKTLLLNQRVGLLRINKNLVNPSILAHMSNMRAWRDYSIASASLGVQANLSTHDILYGEFIIPGLKEQNAIAEVLSTMDKEIYTLKQKLSKYRQIKQGMMQELLTGKTRLV